MLSGSILFCSGKYSSLPAMSTVLHPLLRYLTYNDGSGGEPTVINSRNPNGFFDEKEAEELSFLEIILAILKKYLVRCMVGREDACCSMEIGRPTDVRHVAHVTFDRFHGFLGLPVEFEPEVPQRAPSASTKVFGVSAESMQCSFDSRGNSVPTILLLMQRSLYQQGGLRAEGLFRINAENSQEEYVRDQLNNGFVPDGVDVHCLAGLIKAWFRELPAGVLDYLEPEILMQCESEEDCSRLTKLLPPPQAALLDWAINLMADVVQEKQQNKMNARNIAVVFAPNMTQITDPPTAIMHVVQVMNALKMLILRTLKEREEAASDYATTATSAPEDDDEHQNAKLNMDGGREQEQNESEVFEPQGSALGDSSTDETAESFQALQENQEIVQLSANLTTKLQVTEVAVQAKTGSSGNLSSVRAKKAARSRKGKMLNQTVNFAEKLKGSSIMNHISSRADFEAEREVWR